MNNMNILKKVPDYPETKFVAESKGDYIQVDMVAPGYTVDDLTIEARENGVLVVGKPKKSIGDGRLLPGFSNFFNLDDPKKFDRKNVTAEIYNGVLTVKIPVMEEYRTVKINVVQATAVEN
jgi:HSP20 family molecular chaperone IbpA